MSLLGGIQNDYLAIILIVIAVVIVAVAAILYFLVFKKKIDAKLAENKQKKETKKQDDAKTQSLAASIFKEEEAEEKGPSRAELKEFDAQIRETAANNKKSSLNARNLGTQVEKPKAEKKTKPDDDNYDPMKQFRR